MSRIQSELVYVDEGGLIPAREVDGGWTSRAEQDRVALLGDDIRPVWEPDVDATRHFDMVIGQPGVWATENLVSKPRAQKLHLSGPAALHQRRISVVSTRFDETTGEHTYHVGIKNPDQADVSLSQVKRRSVAVPIHTSTLTNVLKRGTTRPVRHVNNGDRAVSLSIGLPLSREAQAVGRLAAGKLR